MKMLFYLLLLLPDYSFACDCTNLPFMARYHTSDFIARVRIIKASKDEINSIYRNIDIQILELFKGKTVNSLKVVSNTRSTCGISTPENTDWVIFASYDDSGNLSFASCSGSQQIEKVPYDEKYPNYKKNIEAKLSRKLETLTYLKKENLILTNEYHLTPNLSRLCFDDLKGLSNGNQLFSVFELTVQKDLFISDLIATKEFDNKELAQKLLTCLKQTTKINAYKIKEIPAPTKVLIILFYYPAEGEDKSFISAGLY